MLQTTNDSNARVTDFFLKHGVSSMPDCGGEIQTPFPV